ncbi:MAG: alanyl-tRNA synthetase [Bacillales bacterium]|jgi:alanyl-tRNA synthetase|nr:alanyl-tRNA synthetase [Bacillales bacterium]
MMNKLYYEDQYLTKFKAIVTSKGTNDNGALQYVILNRTAFYPNGGGQPSDIGYINGIEVINVEEIDGEIHHYIREDNFTLFQEVVCEIDWIRRFDHMQQHTGQHLLSAAFYKLYNIKTISFHLGKETSTIDIDSEEISSEQLFKVEEFVKNIINSRLTITTKFISKSEMDDYPVIKEITTNSNIRIVIIPDIDYNGCGGTHVANTSELGGFAILGFEKQKGKLRVEFIYGNRVNSQFRTKHLILKELSRQLNSPTQHIVESVKKLISKNMEYDKLIKSQNSVLLDYEAQSLGNCYTLEGHHKVAIKYFENRSFKDLVSLTKSITTKDNEVIFIGVLFENDIIQIACGRGDNSNLNMKSILDRLLALIDGRGGGNEKFAQGKGKNIVTHESISRTLHQYLNEIR